eukprot:406150_1
MSLNCMFLEFFVCILYVIQSQYCPLSSKWKFCGTNDHTCTIPSQINQTIVSYGGFNPNKKLNDFGQWSFIEISNTRNANFTINCNSATFGQVFQNSNAKKGCCYLSIPNLQGASLNENNWKRLSFQNQQFLVSKPTLVKYGAYDSHGASWTYRWLEGEFTCNNKWFAQPTSLPKDATFICEMMDGSNVTVNYDWKKCGDSSTNDATKGKCNLNTPNKDITCPAESIKMVQYGSYPTYVYRYAYSTNNNSGIPCSIPCNNNFFGSVSTHHTCYISSYPLLYGTAIGQWVKISNCPDGKCMINYGVSQPNEASDIIEQSVENGFTFLVSEVEYSLNTEISINVNYKIESAYTRYVDQDCSVNCTSTSDVYQWQFMLEQYQGVELNEFKVYGCYYVCSENSTTTPQCPPGYCKPNTSCTECQGWTPPNN